MQYPDPNDIRIERVVRPGDVNPDDRSGSGVMVLAPWEFGLISVRGLEERYSAHWVCPRCLDTGFLGHQIDLQAGGESFRCTSDEHSEDRDYIHIPDTMIAAVLDADSVDLTVNPSIGCTTCGFHCYLEDSEYRVLSDWQGAESDRDAEQIYSNRLKKLHEHRPDVYNRLAELVEGDAP